MKYNSSLALVAPEEKFDHTDSALMHDVIGNDNLAKPIQALLCSLAQIEAANGSFGADEKKALGRLLPQLEQLREACIREWLSS